MKKFLSFVLAICMLVAIFSVAFTAFAADEGPAYNKDGNKVVLLVAISIGLVIAGIGVYNHFMKE